MGLKKQKGNKKEAAKKEKVVEQEVKAEVKAPKAEKPVKEEVAAAPAAEKVIEPMPVFYSDTFAYVVKAGKTFEHLSDEDVFDVISGLLGKVERITIERKPLAVEKAAK